MVFRELKILHSLVYVKQLLQTSPPPGIADNHSGKRLPETIKAVNFNFVDTQWSLVAT